MATGELRACTARRPAAVPPAVAAAPNGKFSAPSVDDVLHSSGQPLDASVRRFMEPRFGLDFSHVRVHSDALAARSADMLDARAFTVGSDIVLGADENAPDTADGRQLLAHELAHVVQQAPPSREGATASATGAEREAAALSRAVDGNAPTVVSARVPFGTLQRQETKNPRDDTAKAIIARAKDVKTAAAERAVQLVKDIVATYYSGDAAKVNSVVYDNAKAGNGLLTQSVGSGSGAKGTIYVGDYFLEHVNSFARRVLQVGHELEHVDQYRSGLAGAQHKDLREFRAFHDEVFASEKPGTGQLDYIARRDLIDGALGYFYCLTGDEQNANTSKKEALLKRRTEVDGKRGNEPTTPPTSCKRQ
jgi:hypothetical protein